MEVAEIEESNYSCPRAAVSVYFVTRFQLAKTINNHVRITLNGIIAPIQSRKVPQALHIDSLQIYKPAQKNPELFTVMRVKKCA